MFFQLLTISAAAAAFFGSVSAQVGPCNDADRYGVLTFSNPIVLGEPTVFNANFTCALFEFGVPAVFSDYILQATADPADPGLFDFIPMVYFARRDVPASQIDTFNFTWKIMLWTTRVELTDSVGSTPLVGGVENPATLVTASD
ncbi:hypothetical protein BDP27DRAFT_1332269 [Rhodocollybia butyracea]|uniref:Uncharacterized protein n=1 Tax=Rhodocollybia butyracea TaxID=206335 RepID=A0A9P5PMF5_9AGAR|nr:hypothetical protein BDP27DRAFT_1332269 [Rhodocollybia butyracea]